MGWTLVDVVQTSLTYPDTFIIPAVEARINQREGDLVGLHFVMGQPEGEEPRAERMWVEITSMNESTGTYTGVLTNEPLYIESLHAGDTITFEPRHIARIILKENDPDWLAIGEDMALVSKMCIDEAWTFRYLYREQPDHAEDSGWRLFYGNETPEYTNDPDHVIILNIYDLCERDSSLRTLFRAEYGSAFERADKQSPWVKVEEQPSAE
ncbi:DUF2185 domain-containing protein [Paenibacillus sp. 2TAB23]|uniref:immunity protein Imm33 domain-containing protein n=1 Tax=Paenibacillus sp. 2TAB23 TaxID=3233004 RepID=UPI003F9DCB33